ASSENTTLTVNSEQYAINKITKCAFESLDQNGIIQSADGHSCSECTHEYKATADNIAITNMIVIDGIIMGPRHCAFEDCDQKLENEANGVFCTEHRILCGHLCHIADCDNYKEPNTKTCIEHDNRWHSHLIRFGRQSL
ncbi:hypothetical protein BDQ17DRAFT_1262867, partial [Cyathus striatus]